MNTTYGYARVSTRDQNEDRQVIALKRAGVSASNIVVDHKSGKDFDRPAWKELSARLIKGDTLFVTSIDRFGRNYEEMLSQWRYLVKERGVNIRVLDMPSLDAIIDHGLPGVFVADVLLQAMSFVAQTERENIKERQREGIAAAHLRGVVFGRPRIAKPRNLKRLAAAVSKGAMSIRRAAKNAGVSKTTMHRWLTMG